MEPLDIEDYPDFPVRRRSERNGPMTEEEREIFKEWWRPKMLELRQQYAEQASARRNRSWLRRLLTW